ncbi:hypothetical protein F66182_4724 [Fusarium sp. NRRL 66182]|nr:hypothetical protein F66182_4724 [Fusarium sp. NRRL 66182]
MPPEPREPRKRIKRERSPDPPSNSDADSSKRQATKSNGVISQPPEFAWTTCGNEEGLERLRIKEAAVKSAENNCARVRMALESTVGKIEINAQHEKTEGMEHTMIKEWLKEHCQLRQKHQNLEILAGVEGPTGAGKSSFLGALLGIKELFPSGHQGAATAVVGKVSWNWDNAPAHRFRARVTFKKKEDIEEALKSLLKDLNHLSGLKRSRTSGEYDGEDDCEYDGEAIADEITITKDKINYELPKVKAVWGLKRKQLQDKARKCIEEATYGDVVQEIFSTNPKAVQYLSNGFLEIKISSKQEFSGKVKPFLDSTYRKHGGVGRRFAVWPLVENVHLYVKSKILESGLTLVDLPGCGDATASRSEIAREFSHRLDVRIVVCPVARATDEKQGQALIQSGFDEAQMKILGKYDGYGFGVVLTKTDEIDIKAYIKASDKLRKDSQTSEKGQRHGMLRKGICSLKLDIQSLEKKVEEAEGLDRQAAEAYHKATKDFIDNTPENPDQSREYLKSLEADANKKEENLKQVSEMLKQRQEQLKRDSDELTKVKDWLNEKATQTRNQFVQRRLQANHAERQRRLNRSNEGSQPLPIFPVCTKAFWCLKEDETPMQGYTAPLSTGVPAVAEWLLKATLSTREKHLDEMLRRYEGLMNLMRIYSLETGQDVDFNITRLSVEAALDQPHKAFSAELGLHLSNAITEIQLLDPLVDRKEASKAFGNKALTIGQGFCHKYPREKNNMELMAWNTYHAIISRNGRTYTSLGTGITYSWIEDLSAPAMRVISRRWDQRMNQKLREIKTSIMKVFGKLWTDYMERLEKAIRDNLSALEVSFSGLLRMIANIERVSESEIGNALDNLSKEASGVSFDAVNFLGGQIRPIFARALLITGTGSYRKRRESIPEQLYEEGPHMCDAMLDHLAAKLKERKDKVPGELMAIGQRAVKEVKLQVSFALGNWIQEYQGDKNLKLKKMELQKKIRVILGEWELHWQHQEGHHKQSPTPDFGVSEAMCPAVEDQEEEEHYDDDYRVAEVEDDDDSDDGSDNDSDESESCGGEDVGTVCEGDKIE